MPGTRTKVPISREPLSSHLCVVPGMSKAEAQDKYIALVDKLSAEYA